MLRNMKTLGDIEELLSILNEVLSLNAQEFGDAESGIEHFAVLNEVLSLNAQEYHSSFADGMSDSPQ